MPPSEIHPLAHALAIALSVAWSSTAMAFFLFGWLNYPILGVYAGHRIVQLRDRQFDHRLTLPTHALLHYACSILYGLLLPAWYFLTVRRRAELAEWHLGVGTNTNWTIALGMLCMLWLAAHLFEAAWRGGRPQPRDRWLDRLVPLAAVLLCGWFHARFTFAAAPASSDELIFNLFYPQSFVLGTLLVYLFLLIEAWRQPAPAGLARRWRPAVACALPLVLLLSSPFWLSIPRVTHRQAMGLLTAHRELILEVSAAADLDPRLLAGIIYVSHTRDKPRWTGDLLEAARLTDNMLPIGDAPLPDAPVGLARMKLERVWETRDLRYQNIQVDPQLLQIDPSTVGMAALRRMFQASSAETVAQDPRSSLVHAAVMLKILERHWVEWPIDDRPEILATLYNLGYERSRPHADPKPNDFGRRVAAFMKSKACLELFPEGAP